MLAAAVKTPELELDKDEAKKLAENVAAVNAFYGKVIDPKIMAWTALIMTCGQLYAPRVVAIKLRWESEKKDKPRVRQVPAQPQRNADLPGANGPIAGFDPSMNPLGRF